MLKILTLACIFSTCVNKDPQYYTASKVFCTEFNSRMSTQYKLHMLGWGGVFDKGINGLYIDYEVCLEPNEDNSSQLLQKVMHDLLRGMNRDPSLKAHLNQYPVTEKNISVSIAFVDDKKRVRTPLSQVDFHNGRIFFSSLDSKTHEYKIYKELLYSG